MLQLIHQIHDFCNLYLSTLAFNINLLPLHFLNDHFIPFAVHLILFYLENNSIIQGYERKQYLQHLSLLIVYCLSFQFTSFLFAAITNFYSKWSITHWYCFTYFFECYFLEIAEHCALILKSQKITILMLKLSFADYLLSSSC